MLTQQQIEITDFLLKYLESVGGKSSLDDYPAMLRKQGFDDLEWHSLIQVLIQDFGLIKNIGNSDYWIMLTPDGNRAAQIGIDNFLKEIESDEQLERDYKLANIDGIKKANKNSKIAVIIAVIVPLLIAAIQIYFDNGKNTISDRNDNGNDRTEIYHSQFPLELTDTLLVEKIQYLLKHDTIFLNDIKNLIDENE
jgi:hypothetical protein